MISQRALQAAALGVFASLAALPVGRSAEAAPPAKPGQALEALLPVKPALSDEAGTAVLQMGKTVSARELSFTAKTIRVYLDQSGQPLHIFHTIKVVIRRPDRLAVQTTGDDGAQNLFYDGNSASIFAPVSKTYSVMPASGEITSALNQVGGKLNIDFPLVEFFADTPERSLLRGTVAGWQVGTAYVDGVECRHLFFIERAGTDLELWVENNSAAVPHRLVVNYRMFPGQPSFIAEFTNWNSQVHPFDSEFAFQPPPDAKRIDLPEAAAAEGQPQAAAAGQQPEASSGQPRPPSPPMGEQQGRQ